MNSANLADNHWDKIPTQWDTPEELWYAAVGYFEWCIDNPIDKPELIRAGPESGKTISAQIPRPLLLSGLCLHIGATAKYIREMAANADNGDWYAVCQKILQVIYTQVIENTMVGNYNAPFTAKYMRIDRDEDQKALPVINIQVITGTAPPLLTEEQGSKEQKSKEQSGNPEK